MPLKRDCEAGSPEREREGQTERERERGDRQSVKRLDGPLQAVCAARTEEGRKGEREREGEETDRA